MLHVAICDDEPVMCRLLEKGVSRGMEELREPCQIRCYENAESFLDSQSQTDILLLDIQMPGRNGMELAQKIRRMGNPCALIFITVYKEYVFEAFEVEAVDYLCKPVEQDRLAGALSRAVKRVRGIEEKSLFIRTAGGCRTVKLSGIYYCEVINRKIYLHTRDGVIDFYSRMADVEKELDGRFVKCHRSYRVNLDYLKEYSGGMITLENGDRVPVSKPRQPEFMKALLQYMQGI